MIYSKLPEEYRRLVQRRTEKEPIPENACVFTLFSWKDTPEYKIDEWFWTNVMLAKKDSELPEIPESSIIELELEFV